MKIITNVWTKNQIDKLFELVDKGWSFSLIAKELGKTRNSCIGKYNRVKPKNTPPLPNIRLVMMPKKFTPRIVRTNIKLAAVKPLFMHAMDVRHYNCCFPLWDDKERPSQFYCGKRVERGSYCAAHASVCYLPKKRKREK